MENKNRGMAVVEVTLILPIILLILVMVIHLMLDAANDSIVRGQCYTALYTYRTEDETMGQRVERWIGDSLVGGDSGNRITWGTDGNGPYVSIEGERLPVGVAYRYVSDAVTYRTERDVCTDRLRRWQFYGDVFFK